LPFSSFSRAPLLNNFALVGDRKTAQRLKPPILENLLHNPLYSLGRKPRVIADINLPRRNHCGKRIPGRAIIIGDTFSVGFSVLRVIGNNITPLELNVALN
jgi:hypothetical protein